MLLAVGELVLQQGLAEAGDVAVAEDPEASGEQLLPLAVALAPLVRQEPDDGLGDGEADGLLRPSVPPSGSRGSTSWDAQVWRTQPWAGSSQISQARS